MVDDGRPEYAIVLRCGLLQLLLQGLDVFKLQPLSAEAPRCLRADTGSLSRLCGSCRELAHPGHGTYNAKHTAPVLDAI